MKSRKEPLQVSRLKKLDRLKDFNNSQLLSKETNNNVKERCGEGRKGEKEKNKKQKFQQIDKRVRRGMQCCGVPRRARRTRERNTREDKQRERKNAIAQLVIAFNYKPPRIQLAKTRRAIQKPKAEEFVKRTGKKKKKKSLNRIRNKKPFTIRFSNEKQKPIEQDHHRKKDK